MPSFYTVNLKWFSLVVLLTIASVTSPLAAIASQLPQSLQLNAQAQVEPDTKQVLEACVQNRAETLPNPFVDVSPNHWAFKAVLTMYYCGAYRQATSSSSIERRTNQQTPMQPTQPAQ